MIHHQYREDICFCQPQMLVDAVTSPVLAYKGDMEQFDDVTCLAQVYKDSEADYKPLSPGFDSFEIVKKTIFQDLGDSDHTKNIILACEEIFINLHYSPNESVVA